MKRIICIITIVCCSLLVYADTDYSQILERINIEEAKGDLNYCIEVANAIYDSNSSKIFSKDELYILSAGARGYCFKKDTLNAKKLGRYPVSEFLKEYDDSINNRFNRMIDAEKRDFIKQYSSAFHRINKIILYIDPEKATKIIERHHKLITENKHVFALDQENDLIDYLMCAIYDISWFHAHHQVNIIFNIYYPAIEQYINSNKVSIRGLHLIIPYMEAYLPYVLESSLSERYFAQYANQITNYAITYNELSLWAKGASASKYNNDYIDLDKPIKSIEELSSIRHNEIQGFDPRCTDWHIIKSHLQKNETAVIFYSFIDPYFSVPLDFAITFNSSSDSPQQIFSYNSKLNRESKNIDILYNGTPKGKIYVCYIDGSEENEYFDIGNSDVYRKFSLFDIVRDSQRSVMTKYENGTILLCADINYGTGIGNALPLYDSNRLIDSVRDFFSDKACILSGNGVRKINFFNIVDDVQVLHISTHGMIDSVYLINENSSYSQNAFENVGNETYLCLSNYNANPQRNRLTATEIQEKITIHKNCFVFLDACNTNNHRKTYYGSNSLSKAFYLAGARHIVAYLNPINEKVATDFAISFYRKLAVDSEMTYHKAFYQTKKEIFDKYKESGLITNQHGKSSLDIVLWE